MLFYADFALILQLVVCVIVSCGRRFLAVTHLFVFQEKYMFESCFIGIVKWFLC